MAFIKEININGENKTLYCKIVSITGDINNMQINIAVFNSKDESKNINNLIGYGSHNFNPNPNDSNFVKQAYEYLKSLPDFKDFLDI